MELRPPDIVRSAYVDLVVTDLDRARAFWVDLIGFYVEAEEPDALYLRGYEEFVHHSVVLRVGSMPACARMGFRCAAGRGQRDQAWVAADMARRQDGHVRRTADVMRLHVVRNDPQTIDVAGPFM